MTFAVGVLKNVPLCVLEQESNSDKEIFLSKLLRSLNNLQQSRLAALLSSDSSSSIAFDDPINRLVFETPEGEVSTEYESRLRKYLDESVTICNKDSDAVKEWLDQQTLWIPKKERIALINFKKEILWVKCQFKKLDFTSNKSKQMNSYTFDLQNEIQPIPHAK